MKNCVNDPLHPFESELLEQLLATQRCLASGVGDGRPPHAVWTRLALGAGVAAVVLAAGAVVGLASQSSDGPALASTSKITIRLVDALQTSSSDVLYDQQVQSMPGITITLHQWLSPWDPSPGDMVSQRIEYYQDCTGCEDHGLIQDWRQTGIMPAGTTVSDEFPWGTSATTTGESIDVRYHYQQWTDQKSTPVSFNLPLTPANIQHEIAAGNARVAGTAVVDGAQTVELAISGFDGPGSSGDIWVDTSSYLPVRTVVSEPVRVFGQSAPTGTQTVQDDYQFLPATPANLAQLHPVIPPGFTENPTLDDPVTSQGS
jgi:hypothetical protein